MKMTKNMIYNPTSESRELAVYLENKESSHKQLEYVISLLQKKQLKGVYDHDKAIVAMYHVATAASNAYNQDFGYAFDVTARWTVATDLVNEFEEG